MFLNINCDEWNTSEDYEKDTRVVKREYVLSRRSMVEIPIFTHILVRRSKALSWLILQPGDRVELTIGRTVCKVKVTTKGMPFMSCVREFESEVVTKNLWDFEYLLNEVLLSGCNKLVVEITTKECMNSYFVDDKGKKYISIGESDADKDYIGVTSEEWNDFCYCLGMKDSMSIPLRLLVCIVNSCIDTVEYAIQGIDLIKEKGSVEFIVTDNVVSLYARGNGIEVCNKFDLRYIDDCEDILEEAWKPFRKNLPYLFRNGIHLNVSLGGETWDRLYCIENSTISLAGDDIVINVSGYRC